MERAVAYFRVSTQKQGTSGLGLEAQCDAVQRYAASRGLTIIQQFTEIETGTSKRQRSEIGKAIECCKQERAILLIAKLDRLSRNLHFISGLLESKIKFLAVDMPEANHLTIQIMAVMAEHEAKAISERTKEALRVAKARGTKLGNPLGMNEAVRQMGRQRVSQNAKNDYQYISGYIATLRGTGLSYAKIATKLNKEGFKTRTGKIWTPMQVSRALLLTAP